MSQLNALETQLPAVPMLEYLGKYSSDDLKRLGKITEINLCIHKHRLTNNALFRLTVLIAAIYVVFKTGTELVGSRNPASAFVMLTSSQVILDVLDGFLFAIVLGLFMAMVQYFFQLIPDLRRAPKHT